ncbi:hypothetical protein [Arthrobacter sp. ISL-28]|uniref:alpha/beta hydrolase n=1 Tax=Arthrobacter sp. ISL-28 TaxID=2819108 RepID=UPI001BE766FF|nr:hypothetical protein [Arthrobacter sp. ISL-28]MBT2523216.1 hypothetical protein [Arthrobacter sp. ISL-28]
MTTINTHPGPQDSVITTTVDGVPVAYSAPASMTTGPRLAIWLPFLGGTKETTFPVLEKLSEQGFFALSLDPWQHGERATEPAKELMTQVFDGFRERMWPILGLTALDAYRVADWAISTHGLANHYVAGGVSMGGDIAVALAGADIRVTRVAAIVATPDWTRPGMTRVGERENMIEQGDPTAFGQWLYSRLDPASNLPAYARAPAISFELGAADTHVPPTGASRFREALGTTFPKAADAIRITVHDGLDHLEAARSPDLQNRAVTWLGDEENVAR